MGTDSARGPLGSFAQRREPDVVHADCSLSFVGSAESLARKMCLECFGSGTGFSPLWASALIGERLRWVSQTAGERSGCCMLRSCFALKAHRQLCGAETNGDLNRSRI